MYYGGRRGRGIIGFMFMAALLSESDPQRARQMLNSWLIIRLVILNITMLFGLLFSIAFLVIMIYYNLWWVGLILIVMACIGIVLGNLGIFAFVTLRGQKNKIENSLLN